MRKYLTFFFSFTLILVSCILLAQQAKIDSLQNILKTSKEDTNKVNTLNELCRQFITQSNNESAMHYADLALQSAENINFKKGIACSFNKIGLIYCLQGSYEKALNYHLKSLKIQEDIGNKFGTAESYNNIGNIYLSQGIFEKALEFYSKSLKINREIGNKILEAKNLNNMGIVYGYQRNSEKSLEYYMKALKIREEIGDKVGIAASYNNIGLYYSSIGNYEMALECYFKPLRISKEMGNKLQISTSQVNIGLAYKELGKYEESYNYLNESLILFKEIGYIEGVKEAYANLSDLYTKKGDCKQAFHYHILYSDLKDSLIKAQSSKQMAESAAKYDSEQKDKAIQLLNKDKETQERLAAEEKRRQEIILFSISGFSFLVIVFAMLIYRSFRQKKRLNIELEKLSIVASETDNGVLICGPRGEIEWCNAGLTRLLGYTLEDLKQKGSTLEEISSSPEIKSLIHQSIENKKPSAYQALNITKDGRQRWMQSTLTPILDERGCIKKLVVIDMDVTLRKQADDEIKQKNQNITDSINYAQRIQQAILPSKEIINSILPESFIFFKPKNIVSGDFYWIHSIDKHNILLAAVDCTGHGVPGALMSMMGYNLLEQIINEHHIYEPAVILNELSRMVIESLRQTQGLDAVKDGMDISICKINFQNYELEYAGAHNPLYIIRNGILTETKADRKSVGISSAKSSSFSNHKIMLEKGDCLYIFSDGYADQKGGSENRKFFYPPFKELLININQQSMEDQYKQIEKVMNEWRGNKEQIDDMLVIGVRI